MKPKTNKLANAVRLVQQQDLPTPAPAPATVKPKLPMPAAQAPSRVGKVPITGHFLPEVRKQMKSLAIDQDKTAQQLLEEALNDLFRKYNKSAIS